MIDWQWCRLDALTREQLYAIFAAREAVFVVEQHCAYQELDGLDARSHHLVAWQEDEVAAYLRVVEPGAKFAEPSIGRVLVTRRFRLTGLGRHLMAHAIRHVDTLYPGQPIRISAQTYLRDFYGSFGFDACSETYLEDGIPHVEMLRR